MVGRFPGGQPAGRPLLFPMPVTRVAVEEFSADFAGRGRDVPILYLSAPKRGHEARDVDPVALIG